MRLLHPSELLIFFAATKLHTGTMEYFYYLFWGLLGLLIPTVRADDKPCSAFTVNGSYPATFSFYRFYDFRNASTSDTTMSTGRWPADRDESSTLVSNKTTNDSSWDDDWTVRVHYRGIAAKGLTELHYIPSMVSMGQWLHSSCQFVSH